ncbi:hypothetical protein Tco_1547024 [Tanacetum coccineum]
MGTLCGRLGPVKDRYLREKTRGGISLEKKAKWKEKDKKKKKKKRKGERRDIRTGKGNRFVRKKKRDRGSEILGGLGGGLVLGSEGVSRSCPFSERRGMVTRSSNLRYSDLEKDEIEEKSGETRNKKEGFRGT